MVMYHVTTGLDMSNLAAMFGGGAGLGGLPAGVPPVQDPETAYASQLTQLQAGIAHAMSCTVTVMLLASCWIIVLAYVSCHVIPDTELMTTHCVFSAFLFFMSITVMHVHLCTQTQEYPNVKDLSGLPLPGTYCDCTFLDLHILCCLITGHGLR